jgi:hypothetical protein
MWGADASSRPWLDGRLGSRLSRLQPGPVAVGNGAAGEGRGKPRRPSSYIYAEMVPALYHAVTVWSPAQQGGAPNPP